MQEGTGRRVMGSAQNALATRVYTRTDLLWEVPADWSMAEAATVPTAYMTAYYALVMRGKLRKGMRVLIHSATGGVGLAATQICLNRGCEVCHYVCCMCGVASWLQMIPWLSACTVVPCVSAAHRCNVLSPACRFLSASRIS